jgi:choline dehydrogenase
MARNGNGTPFSADVIVVGSGSGGAVVARRLADAGAQVVLLEAGDADANPAIHDPGRLFELWDSEQDWGYRTVPQAACAGRELHWPRGRVLGGSSALNGMIYARGHRSDYDAWAYLGNDGWGYDDVLPLFKRSEHNEEIRDEYHGTTGELNVTRKRWLSRYWQPFLDAAGAAGVERVDDYNGARMEGASLLQTMTRGGRRHSSADAFLKPCAGART